MIDHAGDAHAEAEAEAFKLEPAEPTPDRVERADLDYYPTPASAVLPILPFLSPGRAVLDPACGRGELLAHFDRRTKLGIELDPTRAADTRRAPGVKSVTCGDALVEGWPDADLVICNPPFSHSLEFARRAVEWASSGRGRTAAILLRLSFLESEERREFHRAAPSDVYVLANRPKFRPNRHGKMATDSVTCAWFVWSPGGGGRWRVL